MPLRSSAGRRRMGAVVSTTAAIAAMLIVPSVVHAADVAPSPDKAEAWAQQLGVTTTEAEQQLDLQARGADVDDTLRERLGDRYGGLVFDNAGSGRYVVSVVAVDDAVAEGDAEQVEKAFGGLGITSGEYAIKPVEHSLGELDAAFRELAPKLGDQFDAGTASLARDDSNNRLTLTVARSATTSAKLRIGQTAEPFGRSVVVREGALPKPQRTTCGSIDANFSNSEAYCPAPLRGGVKMYTTGGSVCSVAGFASDTTYTYVVTAGHCIQGSTGQWVSRDWPNRTVRLIGPSVGYHYGLQGDYGLVRMEISPNLSPWLVSPNPWNALGR